ncbi:MAG: HAMP domain-containing sensor histidine kinase, partial [Pseudomonadota bacterium]
NNAAASLLQVDPDATQPPDLLNMLSHIAPPLGQTWQDIMRDVVLRKKPVAFEGTAGRMPLFIAAEPLPTQYTSGANENNQASSYAPFWVLTLSDLTAIRTAQAQREEALAFLSHDIRSPLLSVLALIRGNKEDPHLLEKISNYTQKGLSTSDQFLQLSRLQLQTDFERYDVELSQVVHNAVEQAFFLAREKHISIVVSGQLGPDGEDQPVWLQANGELLERALDNLLSNAVKYSEADTTIHVTMTTTPDSVAISIADEGYGIPEDELVDIFEPFFRSAEQELAENRGAGLGLRFVKTVVDRHQGQIHASSTRHVGTTFTLTLPRPADPQSSTTASS